MVSSINDLSHERLIWVIAGAGISRSYPASLPVWSKIKSDTLHTALDILQQADRDWGSYSQDLVEQLSGNIDNMLKYPEEAMEDLCLAFGENAVTDRLALLINSPTGHKPLPTSAHYEIAKLAASGKLGGLITPNFDCLFEDAFKAHGIEFNIYLNGETPSLTKTLPLLKIHGSCSEHKTLCFRRGSYFRGLPKVFWDYAIKNIRRSTLLIIGYSGYDSDLFPLLKEIIVSKSADNAVLFVNPFLPSKESPFYNLIGMPNVSFCTKQADAFFAPEIAISGQIQDSRASALPSTEIAPVIAFIALASRRKNMQISHSLFWLLQDVADSSTNILYNSLAHFGKAICSQATQDISDEFFLGYNWGRDARIPDEQVSTLANYWCINSLWWLTRNVLSYFTKANRMESSPYLRQLFQIWNSIKNEVIDYSRGNTPSELLRFCSETIKLLLALMESHRLAEVSIPGILEVIASVRTSGNYEIELDALELLNCMEPARINFTTDFMQRYELMANIAMNSTGRIKLINITPEKFEIHNICPSEMIKRVSYKKNNDDVKMGSPKGKSSTWYDLHIKNTAIRSDHELMNLIMEDPKCALAIQQYGEGKPIDKISYNLRPSMFDLKRRIRHFVIGLLQYWDNNWINAIQVFGQVNKKKDDHLFEIATFYIGLCSEKTANWDSAIKCYKRVAKCSHLPSVGQASLNLGLILGRNGNSAGAISSFSIAIQSEHPDSTPAANYYIAAEYIKLKDFSTAINHLLKAAGSNHEEFSPLAHYELGAIHVKLGEPDTAICFFKLAIKSNHPEVVPVAEVDLGVEYAKKGNYQNARDCWEKVVRSGHPKQSEMAQRNLLRLTNI